MKTTAIITALMLSYSSAIAADDTRPPLTPTLTKSECDNIFLLILAVDATISEMQCTYRSWKCMSDLIALTNYRNRLTYKYLKNYCYLYSDLYSPFLDEYSTPEDMFIVMEEV